MPPDLARLLHDLRGPLNSVAMHLEVLKRSATADRAVDETLQTALQQLGRLAEMIPAALEVAALELGATRLVDLGALARRAAASHPAVTIGGDTWPAVLGDERLLFLAVDHLLRNALEATPTGALARAPELRAVVEGATVAVTVRDWGTGLRTPSAKLLVRLLGTTKPGHRGLGLVTADRVARLHGGTLRFDTPPGGAAVTLVLPLP